MGLRKINCLTGAKPVAQLRVDLADFEGRQKYAYYRYFSVGDSTTHYKLRVGGYMSGSTAGDSLTGGHSHNGRAFSTYDKDNDARSGNCAESYTGAWWYNNCFHSHLNGKYLRGTIDCKGVFWFTFNTPHNCYSQKWSEMKLRLI